MAFDPLPAIAENQAEGEIAALYADIRDTLGIGVVNLVWRHLATIEGALPWVWHSVKPVYVSNAAEREAAALFNSLDLPQMGVLPPSLLHLAGVNDNERPTISAILDTYNRGNALNLVALSTLTANPDSQAPPAARTALARVASPIPSLPGLDTLEPDVHDLVLALSRLGAGGENRIIPSMYRHLAYWPGFLGLIWCLVSPLHQDGRLQRLITATLTTAQHGADRIANQTRRLVEPANAAAARAAVEEFRRTAIARMVPTAMIVRRAMP